MQVRNRCRMRTVCTSWRCPVRPWSCNAPFYALKNCDFRRPALASARALFLFLSLLLGEAAALAESKTLNLYEFKSAHMGTLFTIKVYASDQSLAASTAQAAFHRVADLENVMSDYQADSELMRLCDQPWGKPVHVSNDLFRVLDVSQKFARISGGAFDITVGPYVRLWRFSRKRKTLPSAEELATARKAVGW